MKKILFVCTGNTCRSVMAHYLFKKLSESAKLDIEVHSCGIGANPAVAVSDLVKNCLKQEGIDNFTHVPTMINKEFVDSSDLILTMTKEHKQEILKMFPEIKEKIFLLSEYVVSPSQLGDGEGESQETDIPDPFGQSEEVYKQTFDRIKAYVVKLIEKLKRGQSTF